MRALAVALIFVLAACGGGKSTPAPTTPTTGGVSAGTNSTGTPKGEVVPEVLSNFQCSQDAKGRWNATGVLTNDGKNATSYQVTVYIGQATGGAESAKTKRVTSVGAGNAVEFSLKNVPAPTDGGPCHVQVIATK